MKVIPSTIPAKTTSEAVAPIKKKSVFVGSIKPKRGHKLFKRLDGEITELSTEDFEEYFVDLRTGDKKRKLIVDQGAVYTSALNMKNAIRKFSQRT